MTPETRISSLPISPHSAQSLTASFARYFLDSGKPPSEWAVGLEVELFGFTRDALERIAPDQVQSVIAGFASEIVSRESENGFVTEAALNVAPSGEALSADSEEIKNHLKPGWRNGNRSAESFSASGARPTASALARITLEPGGQIEFSGEPRKSLADVERELRWYYGRLREISEAVGVVFIAAGFDPLRSAAEQKWIPKRRYEIMRPYLKSRGARAWDMMCRTAAIQVNFDYESLDDLAKKFILANRLAPIAAAIFACSPFERGKLSGYKSTRYAVWLETDPDRTGPSPLALEDDFSIERFVDYIQMVPMFFIRRNGDYVDLAGRSFTAFLTDDKGHEPIFQDFIDHLTTIFTEARLKSHIEQRSMDCGPTEMIMAAQAFWKGLMYDGDALDCALALSPKLSRDDFTSLQLEVARHGLQAKIERHSVIKLAQAAVETARAGLQKIAPDETKYLDVLEERVLQEQISPADLLIRNFLGSWNGDIRKAIDYLQIAEPSIAGCGFRIAD